MKYTWSELESLTNPYFTIEGNLEILDKGPDMHGRFLELLDIYVEGSGYYNDDTTEFIVGLEITSHVVVPCAITLKPLEIEVNTTLSETFVFEPEQSDTEDAYILDDDFVDLDPYVRLAAELAIPLKVIDPDLEEYPSGDGWTVMTESQLVSSKEDEIDPRLAKLKEFNFKD